MLTKRIIPCLDVDRGRVVKGVSFVDIRDAGDPAELAAFYDREGADELVFLDITASSDARQTMIDVVKSVSEQVFIPLTVGGGAALLAGGSILLWNEGRIGDTDDRVVELNRLIEADECDRNPEDGDCPAYVAEGEALTEDQDAQQRAQEAEKGQTKAEVQGEALAARMEALESRKEAKDREEDQGQLPLGE